MSNWLTDARQRVADALTDVDVTVYAYAPEQLDAPAAVVLADQESGRYYVTPGTPMGAWKASLVVRVYGFSDSNLDVTEDMDALIVSVCDALQTARFSVAQVHAPQADTLYKQMLMTVDITIDNISSKGEN